MRIKGKRYCLDNYPMFRMIYNVSPTCPELLLKTGRQVSKSTFNSKEILADSMIHPHLQTLFVVPLKEQAVRFSRNYLGDDIAHTPVVKDNFWDTSCQENVMARGLKNGSLIQFQYAFLDAERVRGIAADKLVFDEVQDIQWDNIPIINECLSASSYSWRNYTGTPKTIENSIERLWQMSTMCEWCVTCSWCKSINIPDKEHAWAMIGDHGPVCHKCNSDLRNEVFSGQWRIRNSNYKNKRECSITGFHIPQIILPMHFTTQEKWDDLLKKQDRYSQGQFANEVLGLSFDAGGRLVTITELHACSVGKVYDKLDPGMQCAPLYAGIDWGISAQTSYTVIVIGGFDAFEREKFRVVYAFRFKSTELLKQIDNIIHICKVFGVKRIGADQGVGYTNNEILKQHFGERVLPFNYQNSNWLMSWKPKKGFCTLDKNTSLNLLFMAMKQRLIEFPPVEWMKDNMFYEDILSVYEEIIESQRGIYKVFAHNRKNPDDFLHALNFAVFAGYSDMNHPVTRMATNHDLLLANS